jgi:hypothetical protein
MAETWWDEDQASQYLAANAPFGDRRLAREEIKRMLEEGKLQARYRRPDGTLIPIEMREWRRKDPLAGFGVGELEWSGFEQEYEREELQSFECGVPKFGVIEVLSEPLRRMCSPAESPTPNLGGRPAKQFTIKLAARGAAWLAANGVPDTNRELEDVLKHECDARNWKYGDTQIREMVSELIKAYKADLGGMA